MKFVGKIVPRIRSVLLALLSVSFFGIAPAAMADGIVYVNAAATGANDGTTWADAYTDIAAAIADANAKGASVYVAKGIYTITDKLTVTAIPAIYGGFRGNDDAETVDARQIDVNKTILSGDQGGDDCWAHVVPGLNGDFGITYEELAEKPILSDGALNLPPDFTGDYDLYLPAVKTTNTKNALSIANTLKGVIDGLYVVGFSEDVVVKYESGDMGTDLVNCRFVGNQPLNGLVWDGDTADTQPDKCIKGCRFHFNRACETKSGNSCYSGVRFDPFGKLKLEDSSFLSCGLIDREGKVTGHRLFDVNQTGSWGWSIYLYQTLPRCSFVRCFSRENGKATDGYNLLKTYLAIGMRFTDCVFSNNLSVAAKAGKWISTFADCSSDCIGCVFKKNRYEVNLGALDTVYLFGDYGNGNGIRHHYDGCSFVENAVFATGSTLSSGTLIVSLTGGLGKANAVDEGQRSQFINCVFDSNDIYADIPDGVTGYKCRGVYNRCRVANGTGATGIANCTFIGPKIEGVCDILQFDENHTMGFNIVNCHFQYTGGEPYDDGFVFLKPELVHLYSCTLANYVLPDVPYSIDNHGYDPLIFVTNAVGAAGTVMLVPAAKTPDLRSSADVVYNGTTFENKTGNENRLLAGWMTNYAFRASTDGTWEILTTNAKLLDPAVAANPSALQFSDAAGTVRPLGAITRGAVQALTPLAETGATLTLRREPFDGGSFLGPQVQCVAKGAAVLPVTVEADAAGGYEFDGWYTLDGQLYSDAETLTISSLPDSLTLVAKISAPKVKVAFELGPHATFNATGSHALTNEVSQGATFPEVPAFTVEDGWIFAGWQPVFPVVVPAKDAVFTAKIVTASLRTIRVAADSTAENPDGLGWDSAYRSLADAYADAAIGQGELWVKEGKYALTAPIELKSNVSIRGGFAGTETRADEADPVLHPTILNGDVAGNDMWVPQSKYNNTNPSTTFESVWREDGSILRPDPDFVNDWFWTSTDGYRKGAADDTAYAFTSSESAVENVAFHGLTFACFGCGAINDARGGGTALVVSNCQFLVNNSTDLSGNAAVMVAGRSVEILDCQFAGNCGCVKVSGTGSSSIMGCQFDANRTPQDMGGCAGVSVSGAHDARISECVFSRGYAREAHGYGSYSVMGLSPDKGYCVQVDNCAFSSNRIDALAYAGISLSGSGEATFEKCRFDDMRTLTPAVTSWLTSIAPVFRQSSLSLTVRDSVFSRCHAEPAVKGANTPRAAGAILWSEGGSATFLNCTFDDCSAETTTDIPSGVFAIYGGNVKIGVVDCLFNGIWTAGERTGFVVANDDTTATSFNVINSAVVSSSGDFEVAYLQNNAACLGFANCVIDGFNADDLPSGSNGYVYDTTADTPVSVGSLTQGPNGAWARKVVSNARGRKIWLKDGVAYFRDEVANPAKPWRKAADKSFFAATVDGLPDADALLPDAYGVKRTGAQTFFGPVTPSRGLVLILR